MKSLTTVAVAILIALSLTGCSTGSARSVEAYCKTMVKHRDRYLESTGNSDDLMGLLNSVSAIGDLKTMWTELSEVAPEEIRVDTEAVRDSWKEAEDAAVSGNYFALFSNALLNSAPIERVDRYMIDHCEPWT